MYLSLKAKAAIFVFALGAPFGAANAAPLAPLDAPADLLTLAHGFDGRPFAADAYDYGRAAQPWAAPYVTAPGAFYDDDPDALYDGDWPGGPTEQY